MILRVNEWPNTKNAAFFKLFAERCLELVSQKSHDSYRVHALSTPLKLRELRNACSKVQGREIPKKALKPIVDEANEALSNDPVVTKLLDASSLPRNAFHLDLEQSTESLQSRADLALSIISSKYRGICEDSIIGECCEQGSKKKLLVLAKLYLTELMAEGFHRQFIYQSTKATFFRDDIGRCTPNLLKRYFQQFPHAQRRTYTIILCGSASYISYVAGTFKFKALHDASSLDPKLGEHVPPSFGFGKNKKVVVIPNIRAADYFAAIRQVESLLVLPRSFHFIYPSSLIEDIDDECYVIGSKPSSCEKISRKVAVAPVPSKSLLTKGTARSVRTFSQYALADEVLRDARTRLMMMRSLNAASLASNAVDSETQLITLWSAFEALLPQPSTDDGSVARIVHFTELIVPCVTRDYLRSKYRTFYRRCVTEVGPSFANVVKDHGKGFSNDQKLASILVGERTHQDMLLQALSGSPLLLNRIFNLQQLLLDPKNAVKKIDLHEKRVEWQVHRIYRERNDIVHAGARSPFLPVLVENTFLYYRLVIRSLEEVYSELKVHQPHAALQLVATRHSDVKAKMSQVLGNRPISDDAKKSEFFKLVFPDVEQAN